MRSIAWSVFFLVLAEVMLGKAQIQFPGEKNENFVPGTIPASPSDFHPSGQPENNTQDPKDPQARFLFGGLGLGNLFDPCRQCSFHNPEFANECCLKGKRHCCHFTGFGFGGQGFGVAPPFGFPGPVGPHPGPGVFPGFGGHGFGGHGKPGVGGGIKPVGPPGFLPQPFPGGNTFFGLQKFGFCPEPGLFDIFQNRRSLTKDEANDINGLSLRSADEAKERVRRQDESTKAAADPRNGGPQARFFCRDKCFRDIDCPATLKCCMNFFNCRICTHSVF